MLYCVTMTDQPADFWSSLDSLVASHELVIDRPRGSAHPRYPEFIYLLDYGYLSGTTAADGGGIDVWRGSLPGAGVTAVVFAVDLTRHDVECKILLGCTPAEARHILSVHNTGAQRALLLVRDA